MVRISFGLNRISVILKIASTVHHELFQHDACTTAGGACSRTGDHCRPAPEHESRRRLRGIVAAIRRGQMKEVSPKKHTNMRVSRQLKVVRQAHEVRQGAHLRRREVCGRNCVRSNKSIFILVIFSTSM